MEKDLIAYLLTITRQIGLPEDQLRMSLECLKKNYPVFYNYYKDQNNRNNFYEMLAEDPDNWVSVMSFCDVCYEYGDMQQIHRLINDVRFKDNVRTVNTYIELRKGYTQNNRIASVENQKKPQVSEKARIALDILDLIEEKISNNENVFNPEVISSFYNDKVNEMLELESQLDPSNANTNLVANIYYRDSKKIPINAVYGEIRVRCSTLMKHWERALMKVFDEEDRYCIPNYVLEGEINSFLTNAAALYSELDYQSIKEKINSLNK